ncbi:DUF7503 family protein [Haladaptatus sp. ZSTT2]
MVKKSVKEFLAKNPHMMGALFTMTIVLSKAGNMIAGHGTSTPGP